MVYSDVAVVISYAVRVAGTFALRVSARERVREEGTLT